LRKNKELEGRVRMKIDKIESLKYSAKLGDFAAGKKALKLMTKYYTEKKSK